MRRHVHRRTADDGFSLVEAVVALGILTTGLLSLAMVLTKTVTLTSGASADLLAKDKAFEALENIFAARDSHLLDWETLQNVGSGGGVFLTGSRAIHEPGEDGIIGTEDDTAAPLQVIRNPGANGQLGDEDDLSVDLSTFKREVAFAPVAGEAESLRRITITIAYTAGGMARRYELVALLSSFS